MRFVAPELRGDKRYFFVGKTRSGKSFLARYMLKLARSKGWRIVIVDPKKDWMGRGKERRPFADDKSRGTVDNPKLVREFDSKLAVQIIQPVRWDDNLAKFCSAILATGYTIVYFDEISQLVTASVVPLEFSVLWTQGAAIYVGAWCGTQFPRRIPLIVKDQAEIWIIFRIINEEDRKIITEYVPFSDIDKIKFLKNALPYRWFYFWEDSMNEAVLIRPLTIKSEVAA